MGLHNLAKYLNLKEHVDFDAIKHYGIFLVIGAIIGAVLQNQVEQKPLLILIGSSLSSYQFLHWREVDRYKIPEANDRIGGFGSGFMGGLSGHQSRVVSLS